jgi:predicted NAD-dependent protein-ADP-ribosyltransferase YbiA (DUF1768 family)
MPRRVPPNYDCVVGFYKDGQEFDWMANTKRLPSPGFVEIDGKRWPTTEHYFQAMKFPGNVQYQAAIRNYNGSFRNFPDFARDTASNLKLGNPVGWESTPSTALNGRSHEVMRKAVRAKMDQYPQYAAQLDGLPADAIIVEATKNDKKWGDGNDGSGRNHLGIIYKELQLERRGLPPATANQMAYDGYQSFNRVRQGRSIYSYPDSPQKPSNRQSYRAQQRPQNSRSAAAFNIWEDLNRDHTVVEKRPHANLQLHYNTDGSFKRVLYRADRHSPWQEGSIYHPAAQRLLADYTASMQQPAAKAVTPPELPLQKPASNRSASASIQLSYLGTGGPDNRNMYCHEASRDITLVVQPGGHFKLISKNGKEYKPTDDYDSQLEKAFKILMGPHSQQPTTGRSSAADSTQPNTTLAYRERVMGVHLSQTKQKPSNTPQEEKQQAQNVGRKC